MVSDKKVIEKYNKFKKEYDSKKINELLDVIRRFDGDSELYDFFSRYTSMQKFIEMAYKDNDFEKVNKYIDGFNNNLAKVYEGKSKEAISGFNDVLDDIIGDIEEDTIAKLDEVKRDSDAPEEVKEQIRKIDEYIENRDKTMEGSEVSLLVACQRELDSILAQYSSRPELTEDMKSRIEEAVDIKMREIQEEKGKAQKNVTSYNIAELKEYNEISDKIDSVVTKNQIESDAHEATKRSVEQDLAAVKGYLDIPELSVNYEECKNDYDVVAQASEKIAESANFDREAQQSILDGMLEVIENANIVANTEYDRYLSFGSDISELERTRATLLNEMNELNLALDMLRSNSGLVEEVPDAIKQQIDEIEEKYNQRVNQYYSINSRINVLNDKKEKVKEDVSEKLNKEYESNETRISDKPKIKIGFFDKVKDVFTKGAASMKKKQTALMDTYVKPKLEVTKAGLKESEERCQNQGVISRAKNTSMRAKAAIMAGIALISSGARQIEEVPLTAEDFSQSIIGTHYELVDNDEKSALETSTSVAVEDFYKSYGSKINKLVEEKGYNETEKEVIVSNLVSTWQNYEENSKILDFSLNGNGNTRDDELNQIIDNLNQKVINFDCEKNAKVNGVIIGGYTRYHKNGTDDVIINTNYITSFKHEMQHVNMGYVGCQMNFINPAKMDIFFAEGAANYSKVLVQDNFIQSGGFTSYLNLMPTYTMLNTIVGEDTIKNWSENDWEDPNFDLCGAIISKIQENCNVDQKTAEKYLQTLENSLEFDKTWDLPLAEGENLTEYQKSGLKAYEKTKNQTPEKRFQALQNQTLDLLGRQLDMAKSQEEIDVITKKMNALTLFSIDYTSKFTGKKGDKLEINFNHYEDAINNKKANELISDVFSKTETNLSKGEFTEAVQSKNNDVISYIDSLETERAEEIKQAEEQKRAEEEAKKQAEEQKRAEEEAKKQAEEQKRAEEEAQKQAEEQKRAEEEAQKQAEEQKRAEEEAQKQAEEQKRAEEEAQKQAEEQKHVEEEAQKQAEEQKRDEEEAKKDRVESAREEQAKFDGVISSNKIAQIVMEAQRKAERDGRLGEKMKAEKQVSNDENRESKEESKEENDITESDIIRSEASKNLIDKVQNMKSRDSLGRIKAEIVMKLNDGEISHGEAQHIAKKLNEQLMTIDDKKQDIDISENKKYSQEPPKKDDEICM